MSVYLLTIWHIQTLAADRGLEWSDTAAVVQFASKDIFAGMSCFEEHTHASHACLTGPSDVIRSFRSMMVLCWCA